MRTKTLTAVATTAAVATMLVASSVTALAATPADTNAPHPVAQLLKDGTITPAEWLDVRRAVRREAETARDVERTAALTPLVGAGTIDQADLDTIVDAPGRTGLRALVRKRMIDRTQALAIRSALAGRETIDRPAVIDEALAGLVSDGTLTAVQSDAVDAAMTARRAQHTTATATSG